MAPLIVVNSAQLKTYLARFQTLLAQEPAEQARLREVEAQREADGDQMRQTKAGPTAKESEVKS